MIMNGLDMFDVTRGQGMILNEGDLMGMGRTLSDSDMGRTRVDANLEQLTKLLAQANAQQGRTISDKDLEFYKQMLMESMTSTDNPQVIDDNLTNLINSIQDRNRYDADKDLRLDMGLDAEYYNMLEDERKRKEASERAKTYRSR